MNRRDRLESYRLVFAGFFRRFAGFGSCFGGGVFSILSTTSSKV